MSAILDKAARIDPKRSADLDRDDAVRSLMEAHRLSRESTGTGLDDTTTPRCSCGWIGRPVEGWRNFQSTELANQENQHLISGCSVDQLREGAKL